jgi:general secretion pathway protein A
MYLSPLHKEGLAHLLYGIRVGGGFVALTGEVGTGKTTLCHCLLQQLPENVDIALILNPKLNALELLATICDELKIPYQSDTQSRKSLIDQLNHYLLAAHAKDRRTVVMLDEAQNLSFEVLEQVRLLTNLETHKSKLLQIILVGQPELKDLLSRQDLRQLNQRITARYHLKPLTLKQTREYIQHRLSVCGGNTKLFSWCAIRKIYHLTSGVPRLINILCDRALLGTYSLGVEKVSCSTVKKAAAEVLPPQVNKHRLIGQTALFTTLFLLIMAGAYILYGDKVISLVTQSIAVSEPATPIIPKPQATDSIEQKVLAAEVIATQSFDTTVSRIEPRVAEPKIIAAQLIKTLDNSTYTIDFIISQTLQIWGYQIQPDQDISCQSLQQFNLYCLYEKGTWTSLLELNRPIILEFSLPENQIRYGLLVGIHKDQPVIRFAEDLSYPLEEVLSLWNNHYLLIWNPPKPNMTRISPGKTSSKVIWLREQLNNWDGIQTKKEQPRYFDNMLVSRVKKFQQQHQLNPDGVVGPRTILHLQNAANSINFPTLEISE